MKRIIFLSVILLFGFNSIGQSVEGDITSTMMPSPSVVARVDSSKIKAQQLAKRHLKHKKFIQAADTLSRSDYMMSIDRVNDNLIDIRDSAKLGFEIVHLKNKITSISTDFGRIQSNFKNRHLKLNIKNLYLYKNFAGNLDDRNDRVMDHLQKLYLRVYHAKLRVKTVLKDSVFRVMYADSMLRNSFESKLTLLERKWEGTDSITKLNIDSLNALKVISVDNSINLTNLLSRIDRKIEKANSTLFVKEFNYLWENELKVSPVDVSTKSDSQFEIEQKAFHFYISQTWGQRLTILVLGLLLFIWLFGKRKLLKHTREHHEQYAYLNLSYITGSPVLSLFAVLLCLMPFFDAYAPTSYVAIEYGLLLIASILIFLKSDERALHFSWIVLVVLYAVEAVSYLFLEPHFVSRCWMIFLQLLILFFSLLFYKRLTLKTIYAKWIKISVIISLILSLSAIISNLFGRVTLSGFLGLASTVAITQAVVLIIFVQTIIELILFQLLSSRIKKGIDKPFDSTIVIDKIKMPLFILAFVLWIISLTSSLNIYHTISNFTADLLTDTHTIGSISFKLTSVLLFFVIIWFAHILQRLISFLFGEIGVDGDENSSEINKGQHSRLLITRLLVLIGGYLLAIAASGLPIDKLTFLLGALGVGIGMGLQNVVNNFVSGIILIFDGSLQIGDEIEISGQAGKVKEIGLRASTLNTADGAEVIIPNGNILSQNIVNWTFSNDQKRVSIEFTLKGTELDANVINEIINDTIKSIPHVIAKRKPVILYSKVNRDGCTLTVRFWSTISKIDTVKSDASLQLNAAFAKKDIRYE